MWHPPTLGSRGAGSVATCLSRAEAENGATFGRDLPKNQMTFAGNLWENPICSSVFVVPNTLWQQAGYRISWQKFGTNLFAKWTCYWNLWTSHISLRITSMAIFLYKRMAIFYRFIDSKLTSTLIYRKPYVNIMDSFLPHVSCFLCIGQTGFIENSINIFLLSLQQKAAPSEKLVMHY